MDSLKVRECSTDLITLSLYFTIAVEKPFKEPHYRETIRDGQHKRIYESLTPSQYFHICYKLLPCSEDQKGRVYKTDLVSFGNVVAKVYTDTDTRVIRAFSDTVKRGDEVQGSPPEYQNSFYWRHRHRFGVDRDILLQLHQHVLEVRLWTNLNKLSARACYDRPKAFRIPCVDDDGENGTKLTRKLSKFPEVSHDTKVRNTRGRTSLKKQSIISLDSSVISIPSNESYASPIIKATSTNMVSGQEDLDIKTDPSLVPTHSIYAKRAHLRGTEMAKILRQDAEGTVVLRMNMSQLFSKEGVVKAKMEDVIQKLKGFEVVVTATGFPEHLMKELKPMNIIVEKVTQLPVTPLSHEELKKRCDPVYVQYTFPTTPLFRTPGLPHSSFLTFLSSNVIFLGTIERSVLLEHLRGPPLVIEIHDRDTTLKSRSTDAIFGDDSKDDLIGIHAFSSNLPNLVDRDQSRFHSPYGIAILDLRRLLEGHTTLEIAIPVTRGPRNSMEASLPLSKFDPPPGDYLESGCELTIRIELGQPLTFLDPIAKAKSPRHIPKWKKKVKKCIPTPPSVSPKPHQVTSPFNRVVYVISSEGLALLQQLLTKVNEINAKSLGLESLPSNVLQAALSTYKLTKEQLSSGEQDVLTGFQVEDSDRHIIVLEGLRNGGVKTLWENLPRHHSQDENLIKMFYNSEYEFSQRLYGSLDVDLPNIKLFRPLKEIIQQSFIYIQGYIPSASFRALMCLSELDVAKEMADLTRNNLFPTANEVAALSLQFSHPSNIESEVASVTEPPEEDHTPERPMAPYLTSIGKRSIALPMDTFNHDYMAFVKERRKSLKKDHIQFNIEHCGNLSEISHSRKSSHYRSQSEDSALPIHNYSSQIYNSTWQSLARLREGLDPSKRYTFCQDYHYRTVIPVDTEAEAKAKRLQSKRMWRTKEGFVYPGVPSSKMANTHPMKPDQARLEELSKSFEDNLLHSNKLKPTVEWLKFSAADRHLDFDLWKKPPCDINMVSVHSQGKPAMEPKEQKEESWEEKVIVDDIHFHTHREGIRTELSQKAASRLDTLQGLLKDPPKKLSLRKDGFKLEEISPLGVIRYPGADPSIDVMVSALDKRKCCLGYKPGPHDHHSLKIPDNAIPRNRLSAEEPVWKSSLVHSQPFRLYYHPTPSYLSNRPIKPLSLESQQTTPMFQPESLSSDENQPLQSVEEISA